MELIPVPHRRSLLHRALCPVWVNLAPLVDDREDEELDIPTANIWSLVLASRHIPHRMRALSGGRGRSIQVQEWFAQRAAQEIRLYVEENWSDSQSVVLHDLRPVGGREPTVVAIAGLVLFFLFYNRIYAGSGFYPHRWVEIGSANAEAMLHGEWWRGLTAMTLHADGAHLFGNAIVGGIFIWLVARRLGSGLSWLLVIMAGMGANMVNSIVLGPPHDAIGFSTASFGAAGVLAGIASFGIGGGRHGYGAVTNAPLLLRFRRYLTSAVIPAGAGLGLLAMLGSGGENVDLGGHLFGFLLGCLLGVGAGAGATRIGLPGKSIDRVLYVAALALPLAAWIMAWLA